MKLRGFSLLEPGWHIGKYGVHNSDWSATSSRMCSSAAQHQVRSFLYVTYSQAKSTLLPRCLSPVTYGLAGNGDVPLHL